MVSRTRDGNFGTVSGDSPNTAFGGDPDTFNIFSGYTITNRILMGGSADVLTINWATVEGDIAMGAGGDLVVIDSLADVDDPSQETRIGTTTTAGSNVIQLGDGNDELNINGNVYVGFGIINGGDDAGADVISINTTNIIDAVIDGGNGTDTLNLIAGTYNDSITGGAGIDTIDITDGTYNAVVSGGADGDNITVGGGTFNDTVTGAEGADNIFIQDGIFTNIDGGDDNDTILFEGGSVSGQLAGGFGSDAITVTAFTDDLTIDGNEDADGLDVDTLDLSGFSGGTLTIDPGNAENGTYVTSTGQTITFSNIENVIAPVCFARGTRIITPEGEGPIEELRVGDMVLTKDNGYQPIRWIGSRALSAQELEAHSNFRPICVPANALAPGIPEQDLTLSPQHRILVGSAIAMRMFDTREVLVPVKHLVGISTIHQIEDSDGVEYFHFLFDQHEIVLSNGAYSESLFPGPEALKSVEPEAYEEIAQLFPELVDGRVNLSKARKTITRKQAQRFGIRHEKNRKPIYEAEQTPWR